MTVWEQVVEIMTRTNTTVESAVQLVMYVVMVMLGFVAGWVLHKVRSER